MESTQELTTRIDAPLASMDARRKQFRGKFRWLLVSLVVWATATPSGYAQAWRYHPKKSWEYHPKTSWEYHPKKSWEYHPKTSWEYHPKTSWEYHPKQKQQLLLGRDTEKNDYRITRAQPLIAELVAQVTGDRVQVESFDIDFIFLTQVFYDVIRCPVPSRALRLHLSPPDPPLGSSLRHGRTT